MKALACQEILTQAEAKQVILVWSLTHQDDTTWQFCAEKGAKAHIRQINFVVQ